MIVALALVSYFVIDGQVRIGDYLAVMSLFPSFGASVLQIFSEKSFYHSGQELFQERMGAVFERGSSFNEAVCLSDEEVIESLSLSDIRIVQGKECIEYPKSIIFHLGKSYHVIGSNGSGKSSLLRIIIGEIESFEGEFLVNGRLGCVFLLDKISYVNDRSSLFTETVRQNIDVLGIHQDNEILQIMSILNLSLDLNMVVEDNGRNISAGQRQKISLARALMRHKDFLIMDEATSCLDSSSAENIYQYILTRVKTVIIVDHNLPKSVADLIDQKVSI